ncbi:hypothetical protein GLOIN_2v1483424 [Rhizophagus clarus]|uniref:Uncharacterized protein n=1 Tax=Rhizophagus clarus TaxID=94130 RepID=A0A8H3LIX9_9GLOM|nr:hypothetical protein GLOIN_2v1483424 [Rhizophagus clarus]
MILYKVELSLSSFKGKIYTIDEIEDLGVMMKSMFEFKEYFNNDDKKPKPRCLHVFIVPTIIALPLQDVPQVTLPKPSEIFKNFLKSKHRQFLNEFIKNNDALPSYDSGMSSLKTSVPANSSGDRPSLLLHNLSGDDYKHKPITQVLEVQSAIAKAKAKNNMLIFLGTSGCGKTRTCYELLCENWGLYFVTSKQGNGGSADIERISGIFNDRKIQDFEKNCEITVEITLKIYSYDDDIFHILMLKLIACLPSSVTALINEIYMEFNNETFIIVLDKIQVLKTVDKGKFRSRTNEQEEHSLLSPVVQAMKEPASMVSNNRCFISCGTGLGILSLEEVLVSGILKLEIDILKFTEFGEWQNIDNVKNHINKLVELTDHDYNYLYNYFHGRKQSLCKQLSRIIEKERANHVKSINVLNLYKRVALAYYYSGSPFLFSNIDQMSIVESDFGCLWFVDPPTKFDLKKMCDDDNLLEISSVDTESMLPARAGRNSLVAYVDEPFAIAALFNFFKNNRGLSNEILKIMSIVNNPSVCDTLWQTYLPKEFEQMFNGKVDVKVMPIFFEIAKKYDLPAFCIGSPNIVKSSNESMPLIKNATTSSYTLNKFFTESSEERPAFFIPDDRCGPDLIFFVKFKKEVVPVFVQIKLRYSVKAIAEALSTIDPDMFYKDKNGKMFQEELNKPIVEKIKKRCENGFIGILVAYPADILYFKNHLLQTVIMNYEKVKISSLVSLIRKTHQRFFIMVIFDF